MTNYPYPTTVNMTDGPTNLFIYLNTVTNNWFSNMLLIAVYLIFSVGFYTARRNIGGSFAIGGFAIFIIGTLFWVANMISTVTFAIVIAVAIVSFTALWITPD
jgi:hypothetical protein